MFRFVQLAVLFAVLGHGASAQEAAPAPPLGAADFALIDRVTWGANAATAAEFQALGRDRWLDRQLHPGLEDRLPADAEARIGEMWITARSYAVMAGSIISLTGQLQKIPDPEQRNLAQQVQKQAWYRPGAEVIERALLRYLYSENQLQEKLAWFWFNHFNVFFGKSDAPFTIGDYEDLLRRHAFGKFRDLLGAAAIHPAMLRYLDNVDNAKGYVNENYAREIMELHTMGVGSGYTQEDVQALARILTGVGRRSYQEMSHALPNGFIARSFAEMYDAMSKSSTEVPRGFVRSGLFEFNPNRHDFLAKRFLGRDIDRSGFAEFEQALDLLARHPATALYISRKLATFFVSDAPPDVLVQRMAQKFQSTDGDILSVLRVMFDSPEFDASVRAKSKFKDPMQFVLSALRLGYDKQVVLNTKPIEGWLRRLGQGLFMHETPDGYPMTAANWNASGQLFVRFEIARQILATTALFKSPEPGSVERPGVPHIQSALYFSAIEPNLSASTRTVIAQAKSPQESTALFLSSPEFMHY